MDVRYKEYTSLKSLHNYYCVITIKLNMRRWKAKSKKKILYLLDKREYTKMRNGDTTSPPQVPALYRYIDIDWGKMKEPLFLY